MTESLWLVLALSVPSVLVAIVLAAILIRRKAQERRAVELLLGAVKNAEADYRQALLSKLGADSALAEKSADKLVKQRRQYFKRVLSALLDRKPTGLLVIEAALRQFSESHLQSLAALANATAPAPASQASIPTAAAEGGEGALRNENDRLRREVGLTLSALNNIFAEYASMFGDEHTRRDMSLEEILNSMQQLASGEPPEPEPGAGMDNRPLASVASDTDSFLPNNDPFAESAQSESEDAPAAEPAGESAIEQSLTDAEAPAEKP